MTEVTGTGGESPALGGPAHLVPGATARPLQPLNDLDVAQRSINAELARRSQILGFLPAAEDQLASSVVEFFDKLGVAAIQAAAKRTGATAVDQCDVEAAYGELSATKAQAQAWLLALAGVLAGGAFATGIAVELTPPEHHLTIWWIVVATLAVAAAVLLIAGRPRRA